MPFHLLVHLFAFTRALSPSLTLESLMVEPQGTHLLNGILLPDIVDQNDLDKLKTFELYPDDVWVASYPKSGTTWAQQIVRLVRNRGAPDDMQDTV